MTFSISALVGPDRGAQYLVVISLVAMLFGLTASRSGHLDIEADWLVARAAIDGTGAHLPLMRLASVYGVSYQPNLPADLAGTAIHPRTPGALLFFAPLALLPYSAVAGLWALLSTATLVGLVLAVGRWWRVPAGYRVIYLGVIAASPAALAAAAWGTQSVLIAALLMAVPFLLLRERPEWAGATLAVAGLLKVFPLLLLPLLWGHTRALGWCVVTVLGLTVAGLLMSGVGVSEWATSLMYAGEIWFYLSDNGSLAASLVRWSGMERTLAAALGLAVGFVGIVGLSAVNVKRQVQLVPVFLAGCCFALLATPVSWIHYDVAIFPAALWLAAGHTDQRRMTLVIAGFVFLAWAVLLTGAAGGDVSIFSRLIILGATVWAIREPATCCPNDCPGGD
jgi:hypothetical protein